MFSKKIVLHFPEDKADQPMVCRLAKQYNLDFNILKAFITAEEGGLLVLELTGDKKDFENGLDYLKGVGVKVQPLSQDVQRNESRCTHCSVCVTVCPTEAFEVEPETKMVLFHHEKCVACEQCVKICPVRAMEISFG
ncbi:MAG: 4Fe-4S binding protein [Deltaproteobacteria bacterium]|nr:4Fe-4S binding protein [Deltaproteobacteria bacterium]